MAFYDAFLKHVSKARKAGKKIIVCGDFNTAHKEIDLARPKDNEGYSGFLPEERAWMDKFVNKGFIDTFRHFNQEPDNYTWWHMRTRARERNVGWRIDYFFASDNLKDALIDATIQSDIQGSIAFIIRSAPSPSDSDNISPRRSGTICQETPYLSVSQPQ